MAYVLDQAAPTERDRLDTMARAWDPGTLRLVADLGIGAGQRCLEAGAGAGSVARALAEVVGAEGYVLAVDADTRFLDGLAPQVEVLTADLMTDDLPRAAFDLVHARLLVAHLHPHGDALARLAAAVAPGGWLLVEEVDWTYGDRVEPPEPVHTKMIAALADIMGAGGFDATYGARLLGDVAALGLTEVAAEFRGTQAWSWRSWQHLADRFADQIVHSGHMTAEDVARWWALSRAGTHLVAGPAMFAVRARRQHATGSDPNP
ncbi:MAG TPA: methyltransferase domain-containing protein [Amycolatopsis sp.]|nr:methyltransferase domain-containing protein [Amycolatopsis sp.]